MNENQNTNQEQKKHFLTLHIPHKKQQKTLRFHIRHVAAICATAVMLAGGTVYSVDASQKEPEIPAAASAESGFTNIIRTSYDNIDTPSVDYVKINTLVNKSDFSFVAIADKAINLANQNSIPSGWPVESRIVSTEFNPTADPSISDGRKHEGMDISTRSQIIPIYATAAGKVVTANYHSQYGNQVIIDHGNGFTTLYAHCDELQVNAGDIVKKGDIIATTGNTGMSTGIHCHYEVMLNGVYQNPRDYL